MSDVKGQRSVVRSKTRGFTLIELLVVMAILAILLAIVLIAVNPVRQTQKANNSQRRNDVIEILNAVYQYAVDNKALPTTISTSLKVIGTAGSGCGSLCGASTPDSACADLTSALTTTYIYSIPFDPTTGSSAITRYAIKKTSTNDRVTVTACDAEGGETIEVSR